MSKRHDAVFDDVLSGLGDKPGAAGQGGQSQGRERSENRFLRRSSALAERASGQVVEKTLRWIEPGRCRMWARHNRRYDLLDETACTDLIEGIKAQGGQEFPAIVRALKDDPLYEYEVICGARRHWTISWLNANNYPQFRFLIEVRDLTDEEAFRLADIENRDRRDISDYERAVDYAEACRYYYAGHQGRMAERLEVSNAWLSRYLDLARLPAEVVRAYGDLHDLREFHARRLKPALAVWDTSEALQAAAKHLATQQTALKAAGEARIPGPKVLATLLAAVKPEASGKGAAKSAQGPGLKARWTGKGGARVEAALRGAQIHLTIDGLADVDQAGLETLVTWLGGRMQPED